MSNRTDFWSRRKAAVQAEQSAEDRAEAAEQLAVDRAALEDKTDAEILAELDLPDPDSLSAGDDFSAFLARRVPDRIRRRALRKLWLTNPVLANLDELVDYGEDYTDAANVVENLQTVYQVGKGIVLKMSEQELSEDIEPEDIEAEDIEPEDNAGIGPLAAASEQGSPRLSDCTQTPALAADQQPPAPPDPQIDAGVAPPRHRMRFAFAD